MKQIIWAVLAVVGLFWSGFAWLVWALAGAGGRTVVTVSGWFDIDPSATQWLADGLELAGGIAQWLVVLVWVLGVIALVIAGWLAGRAQEAIVETSLREEILYREPAIDGEIRSRTVSPQNRPDEPGA